MNKIIAIGNADKINLSSKKKPYGHLCSATNALIQTYLYSKALWIGSSAWLSETIPWLHLLTFGVESFALMHLKYLNNSIAETSKNSHWNHKSVQLAINEKPNIAITVTSRSESADLVEGSMNASLRTLCKYGKGALFLLDNNNDSFCKAFSKRYLEQIGIKKLREYERLQKYFSKVILESLDNIKIAELAKRDLFHSQLKKIETLGLDLKTFKNLQELCDKVKTNTYSSEILVIIDEIVRIVSSEWASLNVFGHEQEIGAKVRQFGTKYNLSDRSIQNLTDEWLIRYKIQQRMWDLLSDKDSIGINEDEILKETIEHFIKASFLPIKYLETLNSEWKNEYRADNSTWLLSKDSFVQTVSINPALKNTNPDHLFKEFCLLMKQESSKICLSKRLRKPVTKSSEQETLFQAFPYIDWNSSLHNILLSKDIISTDSDDLEPTPVVFWDLYELDMENKYSQKLRMLIENCSSLDTQESHDLSEYLIKRAPNLQALSKMDIKSLRALITNFTFQNSRRLSASNIRSIELSINESSKINTRLVKYIYLFFNIYVNELKSTLVDIEDLFKNGYIESLEESLFLDRISDKEGINNLGKQIIHYLQQNPLKKDELFKLVKEKANRFVLFSLCTNYRPFKTVVNDSVLVMHRDNIESIKSLMTKANFNQESINTTIAKLQSSTWEELLSLSFIKNTLNHCKNDEKSISEYDLVILSQQLQQEFENIHEQILFKHIINHGIEGVLKNSQTEINLISSISNLIIRGDTEDSLQNIQAFKPHKKIKMLHNSKAFGGKAGAINGAMYGYTIPQQIKMFVDTVLNTYLAEQSGTTDVHQCPDIITRISREIVPFFVSHSVVDLYNLIREQLLSGSNYEQCSQNLMDIFFSKNRGADVSIATKIRQAIKEISLEINMRHLSNIFISSMEIEQEIGKSHIARFLQEHSTPITAIEKRELKKRLSHICNVWSLYQPNMKRAPQLIPRTKSDLVREFIYNSSIIRIPIVDDAQKYLTRFLGKQHYPYTINLLPRSATEIASRLISQTGIPETVQWNMQNVPFSNLILQSAKLIDSGVRDVNKVFNVLADKDKSFKQLKYFVITAKKPSIDNSFHGFVNMDCGRHTNVDYLDEIAGQCLKYPTIYLNQTRQYYGRNLYHNPVVAGADALNTYFYSLMMNQKHENNAVFPNGSGTYLHRDAWIWGSEWQKEVVTQRLIDNSGKYMNTGLRKTFNLINSIPWIGKQSSSLLSSGLDLTILQIHDFIHKINLFKKSQNISSIGGRLYGQTEDTITEDMSSGIKFARRGYIGTYSHGIFEKGRGPLGLMDFMYVQLYRWSKGLNAEIAMNRQKGSETTMYQLFKYKGAFDKIQWNEYFMTTSSFLMPTTLPLSLALNALISYTHSSDFSPIIYDQFMYMLPLAMSLTIANIFNGLRNFGVSPKENFLNLGMQFVMMERMLMAAYEGVIKRATGDFVITDKEGVFKRVDDSFLGSTLKTRYTILTSAFSIAGLTSTYYGMAQANMMNVVSGIFLLFFTTLSIGTWNYFNKGVSSKIIKGD